MLQLCQKARFLACVNLALVLPITAAQSACEISGEGSNVTRQLTNADKSSITSSAELERDVTTCDETVIEEISMMFWNATASKATFPAPDMPDTSFVLLPDATAPTFEATPSVGSLTPTGFTPSASIDEALING